MERRVRILHLEDNKEDVELIKELFSAAGMDCEFEVVDTREDFEASLESKEFDIILADYTLPSFDGLAAVEIAKQKAPDIP
jgi:CheY-like chemotaxis protein